MLQEVSKMSSSPSSSSSFPAATDPEDTERRQRRIGSAATAGVDTSVIVSAASVRSGSDLWQAADNPQQHDWCWCCCCWPCDIDRRYCTGGGTMTSSRNTCLQLSSLVKFLIILSYHFNLFNIKYIININTPHDVCIIK